MDQQKLRQLRGANDLLQETVEAATVAIAETHRSMMRGPYALLRCFPAIAAPAAAIEQVQLALTDSVYGTIRAVNRMAGAVATQLLDRLADPEPPE
ncbi:MAG: hypothetical protein IPO81_22070 [Kouleothrix sp.]|nr:hypothetical protein [Kouleothrix sp.]